MAALVSWLLAFAVIVGDWSLLAEYVRWPGGEKVVFVHLFGLIAAPLGGLAGFLLAIARPVRR